MAAVTVSADNPRSIRAMEIAATADRWIRVSYPDGQQAYGVPSQSGSGRFYAVDAEVCTCNDFKRYGQPCKHVLAVRLHEEVLKAKQAGRARHSRARREEPGTPRQVSQAGRDAPDRTGE